MPLGLPSLTAIFVIGLMTLLAALIPLGPDTMARAIFASTERSHLAALIPLGLFSWQKRTGPIFINVLSLHMAVLIPACTPPSAVLTTLLAILMPAGRTDQLPFFPVFFLPLSSAGPPLFVETVQR